ncbi:MAG: hypothetical protein Q8P88_01810 [Candidatus Jorgensenbacteria bacterium]|nr:hypothetical protein [Candidatus Jorgensenbacteria bacterium]
MKRFPKEHPKEFRVFKKLDTPVKVQDFIEALPINFERGGDTCRSPLMTLRAGEAHCMEGALLAAAAFWYHGARPLLLDLKTAKGDESHVVALFRHRGLWGAVSKTNHAVLRYRDPVYRTPRELALSYFNEYFLDNGRKTMKSYSVPFNLLTYRGEWLTARKHLWNLIDKLDLSPHMNILPRGGAKLRGADPIERKAGELVQWKEKKRKKRQKNG